MTGPMLPLLVRIARCPVVEAVKSGQADGHPCAKVVRFQDAPLAEQQGPEPWTGRLGTARVLFVSSNPSYTPGDAYPLWSDPDEGLPGYFEDRYGGGPGQIQDGAYLPPLGPGGKRKYVPFWGGVLGVAKEVLDDPVPGVDYALTEVVRCKSTKEHGVPEARGHCSDRYLDATLRAAPHAGLLVLYGKHAVQELSSRYGLTLTEDRRAATAEIAGRFRQVVWLDHPSRARKVRLRHVLAEPEIARLRLDLASGPEADSPSFETTWPPPGSVTVHVRDDAGAGAVLTWTPQGTVHLVDADGVLGQVPPVPTATPEETVEHLLGTHLWVRVARP